MTDTMTPLQRHRCMSRIRGRDTRPELLVRRCLWRSGYRYRLCDKTLPGRPDIVMRKWHTVIFVNGCFWHGHDCSAFRLPSTNREFWQQKFERNRARDIAVNARLRRMGYNVITIWECQLKPAVAAQTLQSLLVTLSQIVLEQTGAHPAAPGTYAPSAAESTGILAAEPAAESTSTLAAESTGTLAAESPLAAEPRQPYAPSTDNG